ncbi:MAG: ketoacid CoA transferase [Pseudomonadota bacterium]
MSDCTLAELLIACCARSFDDVGEVAATGIGPIPRLAAGLAKLTTNPALMMTDGEAALVEEPVPLGPRGDYEIRPSGHLPFGRYFDAAVWTGRRHAMVTPTQVDRFGQFNISFLGGTHDRPKVQMLGARGFPGNSIYHSNSLFLPAHSSRVFVEGEVDMVCSVGYNPERRIAGANFGNVSLKRIVTNLCVLDCGGVDNAMRVVALHPGVSFDKVQDNTGFPLEQAEQVTETPLATEEERAIIARLDPHDLRSKIIKDNPSARRAA